MYNKNTVLSVLWRQGSRGYIPASILVTGRWMVSNIRMKSILAEFLKYKETRNPIKYTKPGNHTVEISPDQNQSNMEDHSPFLKSCISTTGWFVVWILISHINLKYELV